MTDQDIQILWDHCHDVARQNAGNPAFYDAAIQEFARLIAAAEREAIAKTGRDAALAMRASGHRDECDALLEFVADIRKRGAL